MSTEETLTIRTEATPNPNSLKYVVGKTLVPGGSANFPKPETAHRSPMAQALFAVPGVIGVFIGADFFTITREEGISWEEVNTELAPALEKFFESGQPVLTGKAPAPDKEIGADTADPELVDKIKDLLDTQIRPAVAQDGGDIIYRGYEEGIVYLEMHGACAGCPSSSVTLQNGIETLLKHNLPNDVQEVRAV